MSAAASSCGEFGISRTFGFPEASQLAVKHLATRLHAAFETPMSEVIHIFDNPVIFKTIAYKAQVVGREAGHIWEGWIEFESQDGTDVRRTRRETTQPNREALTYWAGGLSRTYLEGALTRALEPLIVRPRAQLATPFFEGPAPSPASTVPPTDRPVLNPFSVGAKGEEMLRRELGALRGWHLRNIVRAYGLADEATDLELLSEPELIDIIVARVQPG